MTSAQRAPYPQRPSPKRTPYPGLRAFTREESDLFFGRDNCIDRMVDILAETRFLAVLGASGTGKSSLVRTGLLDALDLGLHSWAGAWWKIADLHPGGRPIHNLAAALLHANTKRPGDDVDIDLLAAFLRRGPRSLAEWALGGNLEQECNLLILVDQFEELFRYGSYARQEEAEAFVSLLLETVATPNLRVHVAVTMRSEFLGACALLPGLAEKINAGLYLTPRMTRDECQEAIEGPAGVIGFSVEPALVNRLLNDLSTLAPWEHGAEIEQNETLARRADQLPLMQHVLNRLWERARTVTPSGAVVLTLSEYDELGGLSGALDAHGNQVLESLGEPRKRSVEALFRSLVRGTSIALAVRQPRPVKELAAIVGNRADVEEIVNAFAAPDCNFLRTSEQSLSDDVIVDISHESLIRQWTPLREWLLREASDSAAWRRLVMAQENYSRHEGGLLSGLDLSGLAAWWDSTAPSAAWAQRHGGDFETVRQYLQQSKQAEAAQFQAEQDRQMRERNRLRIGIACLAIAFAIVTTLTVWALRNSRKYKHERDLADRATTQAQTLQKQETRETDSLRSIIFDEQFTGNPGMDRLRAQVEQLLKSYHQGSLSPHTDMQRDVAENFELGSALEATGNAQEALASYAEAYAKGLAAFKNIGPGKQPAPSLQVNFIQDAYRYSWLLFDIGESQRGRDVLKATESLVAQYPVSSPGAPLLLAYSQLANLESRYCSEQALADPSHHAELTATSIADEKKALDLADKAAGLSPNRAALQYQFRWNMNLSRDLPSDRKALEDKACAIADKMLRADPMDIRAVEDHVECLQVHASLSVADAMSQTVPSANKSTDAKKTEANAQARAFDRSEEELQTARGEMNYFLTVFPANHKILLAVADVETDLSDQWQKRGDEDKRDEFNLRAKDHFVEALKGRTIFQNSPESIKNSYLSFRVINFSNPAEELHFYRDIARAVELNHNAFPKCPSFSFVWNDAVGNIGRLLADDPKRRQEALEYLTKTIDAPELKSTMNHLSKFSEDFDNYCGAYFRRAQVHADMRHIDPALTDVKTMIGMCTPALNRYPEDIYLRWYIIQANKVAGQALFEAQRYREALPYLKYASHWGIADSSKLLARMYHENLGVERNDQEAKSYETLASGQKGMERYTVPVDYGGTKYPTYIYIRDWPADYPFVGIDDQVKWLKEARGGTVSPEVVDAFHKLQKIANDNKVSFRELVVYALKTDDNDKTGTQSKAATNEKPAKSGPNEKAMPEYKLAQDLVNQKNWPEAAKAAENAIALDPQSTEALELAEWIYHERLFNFDRAYELNKKRVEMGTGMDDFVEKQLTSGRFDAGATLAVVMYSEVTEKRLRPVMDVFEFACLTGEHKTDEALAVAQRMRKDIEGLEKGGWTFDGTKHFVLGNPAFAPKGPEWVNLLDALEAGDQKKAIHALDALTTAGAS